MVVDFLGKIIDLGSDFWILLHVYGRTKAVTCHKSFNFSTNDTEYIDEILRKKHSRRCYVSKVLFISYDDFFTLFSRIKTFILLNIDTENFSSYTITKSYFNYILLLL